MKVCAIQQHHAPGRVEENRAKALHFAEQALRDGNELILFHEELLAGYVPDPRPLAEPADGPTTRAFQTLLQDYPDAKIIYGLTERAGERYYISAPVVTKDGVLANYRKCHLWHRGTETRDETRFYTPGREFVTFLHRGIRVGLMICFDGDFPEMARAYARLGCQMVLWMNNRSSRRWDDFPKMHSLSNSLVMVTSCCCGEDETGAPCPGCSNIIDYDATVLGELVEEEGILSREVHPEKAMAHRMENPFYMDLREDLFSPSR